MNLGALPAFLRLWLFGAVVGLTLISLACRSTGSYPFDYFSEMHYQDSYRRGEPPRMLPPARSVPTNMPQEPLTTVAQASSLQNPLPRTQENLDRGTALYSVNCLPCHGAQGKGDGIISSYFQRANQNKPADYTTPEIRALSDGEIFQVITNGFNPTSVGAGMPPFGALLTPEERWLVISHIRTLQGQ
jgi:mono/diheme cytochrome c family protein